MEIETEVPFKAEDIALLDEQIAIQKSTRTRFHNPYEPWMAAIEARDRGSLIYGFEAREFVSTHLGWGVLCETAARAAAAFAPQGVVEIGAGNGIWAYALHQLGVPVMAFDLPEPTHGKHHQWFDVRSDITHVQAAAIAAQKGDALMLIWPNYSEPWAAQALRVYRDEGGRQLIYMGEGCGGCTADDAFHEMVGEGEVTYVRTPHWQGLHDSLELVQF